MKRTTQTKLELTLEVLSVCVEALPSLSSEVHVHIRWRLTTINGKRCLPRVKSLEHQNLIRNWTQNRTQIQHQSSSEGQAKEWKVQFINDANLPTTCWSSLHQLQFNKWCTQRPEHVINWYHQADHCILHMKGVHHFQFPLSRHPHGMCVHSFEPRGHIWIWKIAHARKSRDRPNVTKSRIGKIRKIRKIGKIRENYYYTYCDLQLR